MLRVREENWKEEWNYWEEESSWEGKIGCEIMFSLELDEVKDPEV